MIPLIATWWAKSWVKWIAFGLIFIAIAGVGWKIADWRRDSLELAVVKPQLEAFQTAQKKANKKVEKQAPLDEAERVQLAADKAALEAEKAKVNRAWERIRAVQEVPDEAGNVTARLSDAWGVCFSAAASGDPADVAACEAAGGDGPVAREPGS